MPLFELEPVLGMVFRQTESTERRKVGCIHWSAGAVTTSQITDCLNMRIFSSTVLPRVAKKIC